MSQLKLMSLGGMGKVTQNMYAYEFENEILLVDCGIGFPDNYMPGVDILIPDVSHLLRRLEEGAAIAGMILTHGHDDHIAATPYLLPELPDFPIYASLLTTAFARMRMKEGNAKQIVHEVTDGEEIKIGKNFRVEFLNVTHSVPDTKHLIIRTPVGIIYHGTDFKLDREPVDGRVTDTKRISALKDEKVLCMLVDCLRIERDEPTKSESTTGPAIEKTMRETKGKYIITLMSSHIHRIQQVVTAAAKHHRKVAFIGRSVEQNVKNALELNMLTIPKGMKIDKREIENYADDELCLIVAGAQGQEGSTLIRAIFGEHHVLSVKPDDKVVFSANVIPGNELNYYGAIDELAKNKIEVIYPDLVPDLHQSGHASAAEQLELISLIQPKFLYPIGGQNRHRRLFQTKVASELGYAEEAIIVPMDGEQVGFSATEWQVVDVISIKPTLVDGLGIGDVGPTVLSDRRALSQAGIVAIVIPRVMGEFDLSNLQIVSKGFVFMKEAEEVVNFIKQETAKIISDPKRKDDEGMKRQIEKLLSRRLFKIIRREPIIVPVIVDL